MEIGIIGSGNVGRTLASGLAAEGHSVTVGTRDPDRGDLVGWAAGTGIRIADLGTTADAAEVAVVATAWAGTHNALALAGPERLAGKVVVDATNPLELAGGLRLVIGLDGSGGEHVQAWLPGARVVKAFNTIGYELMIHPDLPGGPPTLFIAGDDAEAKATVTGLAAQLGWGVHDCGDLRRARLTEPLAVIWIEHAIRTGTRRHAIRMLGGDTP